jgi:hypothetical protein
VKWKIFCNTPKCDGHTVPFNALEGERRAGRPYFYHRQYPRPQQRRQIRTHATLEPDVRVSRNAAIAAQRSRGATLQDIANAFDLTRQGVHQILKSVTSGRTAVSLPRPSVSEGPEQDQA